MSDFNPGEGWLEVPNVAGIGQEYLIHGQWPNPHTVWVREDPVPALPTERYTVILVTWRKPYQGADTSALMWDGHTWSADQVGSFQAEWLAERITGFKVEAEPPTTGVIAKYLSENTRKVRRETAKAVIEAIRAEGLVRDRRDLETLDRIAQDYEAED